MFRKAIHHLINLPGWRTSRKVIVIHSDDWGSIRMPSLKVREKLSTHPLINVDDPYNRFDTLADTEDMNALFEVLSSVKDRNGRHAVITANCVVANPNFEKIKSNGFEKYYFEELDRTFEKYNNLNALKLWEEGRKFRIFEPQFHGREHVNVPFWMRELKNNHSGVKKAFEFEVFGAIFKNLKLRKENFQAAWDFENNEQDDYIRHVLQEGLDLFKKRFGSPSITAIAPSYTWSTQQESILKNFGVEAMQGILFQKLPNKKKEQYKSKIRYMRTNNRRVTFQLRNVFFEPSLTPGSNYDVSQVLQRIDIAFRMNKPAIISSHRLNYIGGLVKENRNNNLRLLEYLLKTITNRYPDVEFMSAPDLVRIG